MFVIHTTLAASAAPPPDSPSTFSVVIIGFLFVMIVLSLLATVTTAVGAIFIRQAAQAAKEAAESAQKAAESGKPFGQSASVAPGSAPSPVPVPDSGGDDPAILAVVAAAVHTVIGDRPHRVVSVRTAGPGWAQEGRRQIFSSHRVR